MAKCKGCHKPEHECTCSVNPMAAMGHPMFYVVMEALEPKLLPKELDHFELFPDENVILGDRSLKKLIGYIREHFFGDEPVEVTDFELDYIQVSRHQAIQKFKEGAS